MSHKGHDPNGELGHGGYRSYALGFGLAVLLTLISFGFVVEHWLTPFEEIFALAGAAVLQVLVHIFCFLHMSRRSTPFWNAIIFFFMILVVGLLISGSLFIMFTATANMMPSSMPLP